MLLPGLLCDETVWRYQVAALKQDKTCIVVDYGDADSLREMAHIVLAKAPKRFAMAGHSMGGRVAMEVMRLEPQRVTHLALMNTGADPKAKGEAGQQEETFRYRLMDMARRQGMRVMGEEWLKGMLHPERLSNAKLWETIIAMIMRKNEAIFAAQIKALLERPDANPILPQINCPTLVLAGREDSWSPVGEHERLARAMPKARLEIVENCGHMSTMEQPEDITRCFRHWLVRN